MTLTMTDVEQLGFLLNAEPYDSQTEVLRHYLGRFSQSSVVKLINYPIQRYSGQTSVHLAATNGLFECLEVLLNNGGNPNAVSAAPDLRQTPLHLAARKGYEKCLQILLDSGANMELRNSRQEKAVHLVRGKVNCERVFNHAIAKFQIPPRTREQQLRVDELHELLGLEEDLTRFYQLYDQLPADHKDLATRWTDLFQITLLYRAAASNLEEVVEFLLARSPNQPLHNLDSFDTPLLIACRNNHHKIATMLLNHSPGLIFIQDVQKKRSALHHACSRGNLDMVNIILKSFSKVISKARIVDDKKFTLDFLDDSNRTPLFNACYYGYTDVVKRLIEFQKNHSNFVTLNVNSAVKSSQRTPLHVAVKRGNAEIIKTLLNTKDIDICPEGRPSKDTHVRLVHYIQKRLHGRVIPSENTVDEERVLDNPSPERLGLCSPQMVSPGAITPVSWTKTGGYSSDSPDAENHRKVSGGIKSPGDRNAFTLPKNRPPSKHFEDGRKVSNVSTDSNSSVRPIRSVTDLGEFGESTIAVFKSFNGKLEVLPKDTTNFDGTIFDKILVTPLDEACVYGNYDIMTILLEYGARDKSGLACRIAHLLQRPQNMELILSFDCSLDEGRRNTHGQRNPMGLHLIWNNKCLPACSGKWFSDEVVFRPLQKEDHLYEIKNIGKHKGPVSQIPRLSHADTTRISVVSLDTNHLIDVPLELFKLPNVTEINLSRNSITKLPVSCSVSVLNHDSEVDHLCGWECLNLTELNVSRNKLQKIPSCVWLLPNLNHFKVSNNNLSSLLPDQDMQGTLSDSLLSVDFSSNKLQVIPRFIFDFPKLRQVNLSSNKLETLPETLWSCQSLQDLDVSSNEIGILPWCEPESSMDYSREAFGTGPSNLFKHADKVVQGKAVVKPISSLRRQPSTTTAGGIKPIREMSGLSFTGTMTALEGCDYSSLNKLIVAKNNLTFFPEALPCLAPNLTELDVSDNQFDQIDIQFLPQSIKKFTARRCGIQQFGNIINKRMHTIVTHNCRHGKFFGHPCQHRSHPRLPCLANLHLTGNKLSHLQLISQKPHDTNARDTNHGAKEIRYFHKITSLDLLFPVLEGLDLSKNELKGIFNPNIGYQSHLKWIWLNKNDKLEKLPMEFSYLKNTREFTELSIVDVPSLVEPPLEYQKVSLTHLLTYMRSRLKESVYYRTIKLFFIGNGERGKTTLLRRLQGLPEDKLKKLENERTKGIDIVEWVYPVAKKIKLHPTLPQVHFLAWDFAGQDVYHTTHQCFYSRRSLYLALFRLHDGVRGIDELDPWLRNVQLRAPGCPVIIVGTHLDKISESEATQLENKAREKFKDNSVYPKIIATASINSTSRSVFSSHMERLRLLIYNVACHLQLSKDGFGLEYKADMLETDPKALFQQQIPKTFLDLQDQLREVVRACNRENAEAPIMEETDFRKKFGQLFEDEDELHEAVYCLNLQGTLLHFDDHGLKNIYFLDPQWLAKLMANVIQPAAAEEGSPIKNGVAEVNTLFSQLAIPQTIKDKYINLLEKFEVALTIKGQRVIIPSLLPESISYPKPNDILSDVTMTTSFDVCYQPPLRRFWVSKYIPDGFWPRLICRIVNDQQIGKILRTIIGEDPYLMEDTAESALSDKEALDWTPWKTGIVFKCKGRTLLLVKQELNEFSEAFNQEWGRRVTTLTGDYRIEVHIYTDEWITLTNYLAEEGQLNTTLPPDYIPGIATKLLVMLTQHVISLATKYFSGMLLVPQGKSVATYMPCWKCFAEIGSALFNSSSGSGFDNSSFICKNNNPVTCFNLEESIVEAAQQKDFDCPIHGKMKVVHLAPDLIFWDLVTQYEESTGQLEIIENEILGKGGFGFVCKGELTPKHGVKKHVAVKVFLQDITDFMEHSTIPELLTLSQEPRHILFAYKEIRQEVSFLASLNNPFLTELCGVKMSPYMCLMLELAPKQSLRALLKEYKECQVVLEPLTLKNTALQISKGLEYLHRHQVVHLDMKSPNVLVWHFPSPQDSRQLRIRQAGNVWIKIADYGISQLSTRLTLRVGNNPVGTPGFMAPELFEHSGQEVAAEKVDVFALGMTFYEMLSHKSPFDNVHPHIKRNQEVKNRNRPNLQARETRSLILFQELMMMCWDQEPESRPKMKQVCNWVESPEFERLRGEISLKDVKSISCACVCRILPEKEDEVRFPRSNGAQAGAMFNVGSGGNLLTPSSPTSPVGLADTSYSRDSKSYRLSSVLEKMDDIFKKYSEEEADSEGSPRHNILLSNSEEELFIETGSGEKIKDEDEDIYQFLPARRGTPQGDILQGGVADMGEVEMNFEFEPYTQIWLCGRDKRKGVLQIFTYNDGHVGHYAFSGYCSNDEITAICPVHNLMWMGTTSGTIKIFHAPTLKVRFAGKLAVQGGDPASVILNILHVEEASSVLVTSHSGEIWVFSDRVVRGGLKIRERISLPEFCLCFHLVKVLHKSPRQVEVWGSMEHNRILVLERDGKRWKKSELEARPGDPRLQLCSYITHTTFTGTVGRECSHVWVSYRNRSLLVSFDALTKTQRCTLNCADQLRHKDDISFQVVTMVATGRKLFVGTSGGTVGVFDSESAQLLDAFSWHKEKVRTLLVMPKEMEPCICNEVPFPEQEETSASRSLSVPNTASNQVANPSSLQRGISAFSYFDNHHYIHNPEPDAVMITSIGNGRRRLVVNEQSKQDRVKIFDEEAKRQSGRRYTHADKHGEDIVLLQWRS